MADVGRIATVVVVHWPSAKVLENLKKLANTGSVFAVVNGRFGGLDELISSTTGVRYIVNDNNAGLARALNQGIEAVFQNGRFDYALLLDQDSEPGQAMGHRLATAFEHASALQLRPAAVGPTLRDAKTGPAEVGGYLTIASGFAFARTIATSGTLLSASSIRTVGLMTAELFIDGIDHDWCFRARKAGLSILVSPDIVMTHDMGDAGLVVAGRFLPTHRAPARHYFITRNTVWLTRQQHVDWSWAAVERVKLVGRLLVYLAVSSSRRHTVRAILQGMADGLAGRLGPLPAPLADAIGK